MEEINVNLYSSGSRGNPTEADYIYCDKYKNCSFYKEGKCLRVRAFLAPGCKFGRNDIVRGYTERAKKYYTFQNKIKNDEVYNKLSYPLNRVALIDGYLFMKLGYVSIRKITDKTEKWKAVFKDYAIDSMLIANDSTFVPIEDVKPEFLYKIFTYKPRAIMGGIIDAYQDSVVPDVVQELKRVVPKIYDEFVAKYPEYIKEPNYIGKLAYLSTLADGSKVEDCHGNQFYKKDGKFYCDNMTRGFVPFNGVAKVEVIPNEKKSFKITDNSQVDENTKFI